MKYYILIFCCLSVLGISAQTQFAYEGSDPVLKLYFEGYDNHIQNLKDLYDHAKKLSPGCISSQDYIESVRTMMRTYTLDYDRTIKKLLKKDNYGKLALDAYAAVEDQYAMLYTFELQRIFPRDSETYIGFVYEAVMAHADRTDK